MSEKIPNSELTLGEQIDLAEKLKDAVDERNAIDSQYPDWDDLIVFVDSDPENRKEYERLWRESNEARKIFDEKVANKLELVKRLREIGNDRLASMIESMFGLLNG